MFNPDDLIGNKDWMMEQLALQRMSAFCRGFLISMKYANEKGEIYCKAFLLELSKQDS